MNTEQKYKLLSMMGYKGPKDESLMSSFIKSNPAAEAKMGQFANAMSKGGLAKGFSTGGVTQSSSGNTHTFSGGISKEKFLAYPLATQQKLASRFPSKPYASWIGSTPPPAPTNTPDTTTNNNQNTNTGSTGVSSGNVSSDPNYWAGSEPNQFNNNQPNNTNQNNTAVPTSQPNYSGHEAQINNLYQKYLNRDAQSAGMDFYSKLYSSGRMTLPQIEADIKENAATENFVKESYKNILGREADMAGLQHYTQQLNSGAMSQQEFLNTLSRAATDPNRNQQGQSQGGNAQPGVVAQPDAPKQGEQVTRDQIDSAYNQYHNRDADDPGAAFWMNAINSGKVTWEDFIQEQQRVSGSDAVYKPQTQDEAEAFERLRNGYRQIFGRNPDQAGLDFYMGLIMNPNNDFNIEDALNDLVQSQDAQLINNQQWEESKALRQAQQKFMSSAYQSPGDLALQQDVERMQVKEGELVDGASGQVGPTAPSYQASTIDPASGTATATAPDDIDTATYDASTVTQELQDTLGDLEAATATPSKEATVRGQLELLMDDFEDGNPPWAQGAMRNAMALMQKRGLGASSMAGQAITQAALESATAIAQQDASTYATFELRNLDNRQQTAIFKAQQRISGLFTDQAATNAARQFNASSENQTQQFMASLQESVSRFNAAQVNAVSEINVNAENAAKQFNATMQDLRDRFNATNSLAIAQSNAQWRQNINTINTAAQNDSNRDYVKTVNGITTAALDQLWQRERDLMTFAYAASESGLERQLKLMLADKQEDLVKWQQDREEDAAKGYVFTRLASEVLDFDWGF